MLQNGQILNSCIRNNNNNNNNNNNENKLCNIKLTMVPIVVVALETVPKDMGKKWRNWRSGELEIGGRIKTIQTTTVLKLVRILRRVMKTWRFLLPDSGEKPTAKAGVKNSQETNPATKKKKNNNKKKKHILKRLVT